MHAVRKLLMALSMLTTFRTAVHALRKMITSGYHVVRRMVRILTPDTYLCDAQQRHHHHHFTSSNI